MVQKGARFVYIQLKPMKNQIRFLLTFLFVSAALQLSAQSDCTDSLAYVPNSAAFHNDNLLASDSLIEVAIVNTSNTFYVYPMGAVLPITPLPPGMSIYQPGSWNVFDSAFNPGDTSAVVTQFIVTQAIPANYIVTFEVWIHYNQPLTDTCKFAQSITVNLNPQTATALDLASDSRPVIYPNPGSGSFRIDQVGDFSKVEVHDLQGRLQASFGPATTVFELPQLAQGRYFVTVFTEEGPMVMALDRL